MTDDDNPDSNIHGAGKANRTSVPQTPLNRNLIKAGELIDFFRLFNQQLVDIKQAAEGYKKLIEPAVAAASGPDAERLSGSLQQLTLFVDELIEAAACRIATKGFQTVEPGMRKKVPYYHANDVLYENDIDDPAETVAPLLLDYADEHFKAVDTHLKDVTDYVSALRQAHPDLPSDFTDGAKTLVAFSDNYNQIKAPLVKRSELAKAKTETIYKDIIDDHGL